MGLEFTLANVTSYEFDLLSSFLADDLQLFFENLAVRRGRAFDEPPQKQKRSRGSFSVLLTLQR